MTPAFETGTPVTGADLGNALGALLASGTAYLVTLSDATFYAPQGSAWSPATHVRHLQGSSAPLVTALRLPRWALTLRFGKPPHPSRSFAEVRESYREKLASGAQAGRYAPTPEGEPGNATARRVEIMREWTTSTVDLQNALQRWDERALDLHQLPHPIMGMLTVREMLCFTVYHTAHHLRRIAERAGTDGGAR
jgi:hypothetical protein